MKLSLRPSSPIWASETSLARTRERAAPRSRVLARLASLAQKGELEAPQKNVFEGARQYFAGQRHRLLKFKTPVTLNWFSTRAR